MKDKLLQVRITPELYHMLQFKAAAANKSMSDYVRDTITQSEIKFNDAKDVAKAIAAINMIGNNLNQIAKRLNTANRRGYLKDIDYDELKDELLIISNAIEEVIKC